jgi:tetratricopeptide (TPR) repeat protein
VRVLLTRDGQSVLDERLDLSPGQPFIRVIPASMTRPEEYRLAVLNEAGKELIAYRPEKSMDCKLPDPATEPRPPEQIGSIEQLYLTGLHLEQYRHATRPPEPYWYEGLKRDPEDARLNNATGLTQLRNGKFAEAESHFARAVGRLTFRNPNPNDGEPFYNLGLARLYLGRISEAYDAFHKSVWNQAWQSTGYYALASISTQRGDLELAMEQVEQSLMTNTINLKARALKAAVLRHMDRVEEAQGVIDETLALDRLDFRMMAERFLLSRAAPDLRAFLAALEEDVQTLLDVAYDLAWSGLHKDAFELLEACSQEALLEHPMFWYTLSWLVSLLERDRQSSQYAAQAEAASPRHCFPARLEEMIVLEDALARNPQGARALYYLGNLYYDKCRYEDAIRCWRRSVEFDDAFSIPWRNLGIAEFNVLHNPEAADRMYERAFAANGKDARLLYEWDQLKKRVGQASPPDRLRTLEEQQKLVALRDDLTMEFITLLNQCGRWQAALDHLSARRFSPWEGGEGLVSAQYVYAHRALAKAALAEGKSACALEHLEAARIYPHNLGEGKHLLTLERDLDYLSGLAAQQLGDAALAQHYWSAAAAPLTALGVHSWFQAMALQALGNSQAAHEVSSSLAEFAQMQMETEPKIDYFATSLPNLLLFDDDLCKRNRIDSLLLGALASHGLGDEQRASSQLEQIVAEAPNHLFAHETLNWLRQGGQTAPAGLDSSPAA